MSDTPRTDALAERIRILIDAAYDAGFDAESVTDKDYRDEFAKADIAVDELCGGLERELAAVTADRDRYKVAHEQCLIERNRLAVRRAQAEALLNGALTSLDAVTTERDGLQIKLETSLTAQRRYLCAETDAVSEKLKQVQDAALTEINSLRAKLDAVIAQRDALMQDCPERYNGDCIAEDSIVPCHIGHCFKLRGVTPQR